MAVWRRLLRHWLLWQSVALFEFRSPGEPPPAAPKAPTHTPRPAGPLALMTLAILYTTLDKDEDEGGLTYSQFLDALMELAFEACSNVAGKLQEVQAAKMRAEAAAERARPPLAVRQSSQLVRASDRG